jgi:hypothetical protein
MANGQNARIITTIAATVAGALASSPAVAVERNDKPVVETIVQNAVAANPVLVNQLNAEAPVQSRILWGNTIAGIGAAIVAALPVLVLLNFITQEQADLLRDSIGRVIEGLGGVAVIGGLVYSTYGRLASGLKPLFSGKTAGS